MPITADAGTRIIDIDVAPTNGIVEVDVQKELYSKLKDDWHSTAALQKMKFPFRTFGDPLGAEKIGPYVFFDNLAGWRIRPHDSDHELVMKTANLVPESAVQGLSRPTFLNRTGRTIAITSERSSQSLTGGIFNEVIDGHPYKDHIKYQSAAVAGKTSGGPGSTVFRSLDDAADRMTTVADTDGNRTTITLNP